MGCRRRTILRGATGTGLYQVVSLPERCANTVVGVRRSDDNTSMSRTYCAILVVAWSLSGLPTLCVGGVLAHPCADHEEHCDERGPGDHSHEESGCSHRHECQHESDCGSDPCAGTVARFERSDDCGPLLTLQPLALPDLLTEAPPTTPVARAAHNAPARDFRLRIHLSDLPLLI